VQNKKNNQDSQQENSFEPLNDFKQNGKKRPWNRNKSCSVAISKAYSYIPGLEHYGEKIANCGTWLKMMGCPEIKHGNMLKEAYFCKVRMCIMCQWRKSLVIRKQLVELVKEHRKEYPTDVPLLLTNTVLNEIGEKLNPTIDKMNVAWRRLMQLKVVRNVTHSWFRSMEITYNEERDDYHPHFHALLMVPKNYFYKKRGMYIHRDEWLRLWQQSMRDDRITQVDIRTLKCGTAAELEASIGEVAKYMTKPSSYIFENELGKREADPKVVNELHYATKGRRLIGFGGYFNKIRKAKKMVDVEKADLVDVDGEGIELKCQCKICQKEMIEKIYTWYNEPDRYLRKCSKETENAVVLREEEQLAPETEIQEKTKVQKGIRPSILLEALRKSLKGEEKDRYGSDGERVQYQKILVRGQEEDEEFQEAEVVNVSDFSKKEEENPSNYNDIEEVIGDFSSHFEDVSPPILRIDSNEKSNGKLKARHKKYEFFHEKDDCDSFMFLRGPP
jgi:plasmid rolling circle replication initiator protein Rep